MKRNGMKADGEEQPGSQTFEQLARLIKEKENDILPKEDDYLLDDEVLLDIEEKEDFRAGCPQKERPGLPEKPSDELVSDSSDDNESIVSESSDTENIDSSSEVKANKFKAQGDENVKLGKWSEAVKCYTEAIEYSKMAALYGNRSLCYMKLEEYDKAERDCCCAIELDPMYRRIYRRRAAIRLRLRDYCGSAKDLQDLRILSAGSQIDPNIQEEYKVILPLARYMTLNADCSSDERFRMLEANARAELCDKEETAANLNKSHKKWPQVVESLSMAIMISPSAKAWHYADRALANFKLGKANLALKDCTEAIALEPSNSNYYRLRAEIRKKIGDITRSEEDEKMAKQLPAGPTASIADRLPSAIRNASPAARSIVKSEPPAKTKSLSSETSFLIRIPVQDVYSSSTDELYDLSELPERIKSFFGIS